MSGRTCRKRVVSLREDSLSLSNDTIANCASRSNVCVQQSNENRNTPPRIVTRRRVESSAFVYAQFVVKLSALQRGMKERRANVKRRRCNLHVPGGPLGVLKGRDRYNIAFVSSDKTFRKREKLRSAEGMSYREYGR